MSVTNSKASQKLETFLNLSHFNGKNYIQICLLSPSYKQYEIFRTRFPKSKITVIEYDSWDLNKKAELYFDLIYAGNIFHYSNKPELWFSNIFNCSRVFLLQQELQQDTSSPPFLK